jgi:hypothetical protein
MTAPIMFHYSRLRSAGTQKKSMSLFLIVSSNYFFVKLSPKPSKSSENLLVKMGAMALSVYRHCGCV